MVAKQIHELDPLSGSALRDDLLAGVRGTGNALKQTHDQTFATLRWKDPVRCVSITNIDIAGGGLANGQSVGGVTLVTGDPVLCVGQTTGSENGVYIAPASGAASRRVDMPSGGTVELVAGAMVECQEGLWRGTRWRLSTTGAITIGTTAQVWLKAAHLPLPSTAFLPPSNATQLFVAGRGISTTQSMFIAAGDCVLIPWEWPCSDLGPDELRIWVSTAGTSAQVVATVYQANADFAFSTQLLRDNTITAATTGEKTITFSRLGIAPNQPLWVGLFTDVTIEVRQVIYSPWMLPIRRSNERYGHGPIGKGSNTFAGVFPSTFDPTSFEAWWNNNAAVPAIWFGV